jgi:hypothetical protein
MWLVLVAAACAMLWAQPRLPSHPLTPSVGTGMEIHKQGLSVMGGSGFLGNLSEWEWN